MNVPAHAIERFGFPSTRALAVVLSLLGAAGVSLGCDLVFSEDLRCSPGEELRDRACVPVAPTATGGAAGQASVAGGADAGGAGAGGGDAGSGGGGAAPGGEFGADCADDTACAEPAPYCAVQPGNTVGFCTITGCAADAALCPAGFSCLDLSAFGAPDFCNPD